MESFNDNMITLYNGKNEIELLIGEKIENYIIINEDYFNYLVTIIYNNNLLILFSFTFFSTLYCCAMKHRRKYQDYVIVQQSEPVKGSIINNDEKV